MWLSDKRQIVQYNVVECSCSSSSVALVEHDACYIILATEICVTRSLSSFLPADDVLVVVPHQCVGVVQPGSDTAVCQHLGDIRSQ